MSLYTEEDIMRYDELKEKMEDAICASCPEIRDVPGASLEGYIIYRSHIVAVITVSRPCSCCSDTKDSAVVMMADVLRELNKESPDD